MVAFILHLGNVNFDDDEGNAIISSNETLDVINEVCNSAACLAQLRLRNDLLCVKWDKKPIKSTLNSIRLTSLGMCLNYTQSVHNDPKYTHIRISGVIIYAYIHHIHMLILLVVAVDRLRS